MDTVKHVLIIDDDEDDQLLIRDRLSELVSEDCEFVICYEKDEAVKLLKNRHFDLCILDHQLPGFEGLDVLSSVQKYEIATPIVMLTGQIDDEIARQAIKRGAQDFVMKSSIDEDIFEKSIRYAISRKQLESARVAGNKIQAENIAKDKFIAHLSHELRTPLTSILGYTSLLLENKEATALHKELSIIQNNGKHLLNLLNDVLDLSKIAAAKFELRPQLTDLQQLMTEVLSLLSVSAIDKGLGIKFVSETPLPKIIKIDDLRLKQILLNLIGNAIKFTDSGSVSVSISLCKQSETNQRDRIKVKVQDTGIGMDATQIAEVFTPFHQVEDVTNRKAGGAGLGLSITSEIVKQMDGSLHVDSSLHEGTCFTIVLPAVYAEQAFIEYHFDYTKQNTKNEIIPQYEGRVLVVDDVFEIRQLVGYFATQTGLEVEYAKHGKQAIERVEQAERPFDVILMDLHMPVMNGRDAVKLLRSHERNDMQKTALVAMTAATQLGLEQELLGSGFDGLISKPIDKVRLWDLFNAWLKTDVVENPLAQQVANNQAVNETIQQQSNPLSYQSHLPACNKLVHLIEDDVDSAEIMQLLLETLGFSVLHSSSGKQALKTIKNHLDISFHLLDLGLPDMSGEALLTKVCSLNISGKLIVVSGRTPEPSILSRFPIEKYMIKPISKNDLINVLELKN